MSMTQPEVQQMIERLGPFIADAVEQQPRAATRDQMRQLVADPRNLAVRFDHEGDIVWLTLTVCGTPFALVDGRRVGMHYIGGEYLYLPVIADATTDK